VLWHSEKYYPSFLYYQDQDQLVEESLFFPISLELQEIGIHFLANLLLFFGTFVKSIFSCARPHDSAFFSFSADGGMTGSLTGLYRQGTEGPDPKQ